MSKSKPKVVPVIRQGRAPKGLDLFDAAVGSCQAIEALARLLEMAGSADDLEGRLAAETGSMIGHHAKKLHQSLITLHERAGA